MSADTLIRAAMDAGVTLTLVDGKLKASGKCKPLVNDLLIQLRSHKQEVIHHLTAANDPEPPQNRAQWLEIDREYQRHHWACPTCIAGSQGRGLRCGTGASLWLKYQPEEKNHD